MACNQCGNTTSNPCACKDTAYTIPSNCLTGYSGAGCSDSSNTCEDIQCLECVKSCRGTTNTMQCIDINGQNFCINFGESLESFMQKLMLTLSGTVTDANTTGTLTAPFYVDQVTSNSLVLNWEYNGPQQSGMGTLDGWHIRYSLLESPTNFTVITPSGTPVPYQSGSSYYSYTVSPSVFPFTSGQTYIFQIVATINNMYINGATAVNLYVTIP
tara:strand:- start:850 stop:1491 length:642 start_codon:yes stop_codon:yes gene_type:complete